MTEIRRAKGLDAVPEAAALRLEVFSDEQGFSPQTEFDKFDPIADHVLICEDGTAVATGRVYLSDDGGVIGRICVKKDRRGQKLGDRVMRLLLEKAFSMGAAEVRLHAQKDKVGFYRAFGFAECAPDDEEEGVPHVYMRLARDEYLSRGK